MPPLAMVRAFEAVARLSSIRAAAIDLSVSHTAVSRHLHNLEGWLGKTLVETGPRGSRLTEAGRLYFGAISKAFDLIATASDELRPAIGEKILTVSCAPGFAARWLTPRLRALQAAMPDVDIVLKSSTGKADFAHFEADVEIRWEIGEETEFRSEDLVRPRLIPVASPAFLAKNPVTGVQDLVGLPLIHEESRDQWRNWFSANGMETIAPLHGPRLGTASLALDAAVASQGVALAPSPIAADDLASGKLIELFDTDVRLGAYILVAPKERWTSKLVDRFRTWAMAEMKASPAFERRAT